MIKKFTKETGFDHIAENVHVSTFKAVAKSFSKVNADMSTHIDANFIGQSGCTDREAKFLRQFV